MLDILGKMPMGLQLSFKDFDFILNAVVTSANLKSERKIEFSIQKLMFLCNYLTNVSEFSFRIFIGISFLLRCFLGL